MLRHALFLYDFALLCYAQLGWVLFGFAVPCHAKIWLAYALLMLLQTLQKYWYARIRPCQTLQKYWLSRAGLLPTSSLLENNRFFDPNLKFLDKMLV